MKNTEEPQRRFFVLRKLYGFKLVNRTRKQRSFLGLILLTFSFSLTPFALFFTKKIDTFCERE